MFPHVRRRHSLKLAYQARSNQKPAIRQPVMPQAAAALPEVDHNAEAPDHCDDLSL